MCTSDGYIVDIYGLNPAFKKDNDLIFNENSPEESESELQEGYILVLDRGYWSKNKLNFKNYNFFWPYPGMVEFFFRSV